MERWSNMNYSEEDYDDKFRDLCDRYGVEMAGEDSIMAKMGGSDMGHKFQDYPEFMDVFRRYGYEIDSKYGTIWGKTEDEEFELTDKGFIWKNWNGSLIKRFQTPQELEKWVKGDMGEFIRVYRDVKTNQSNTRPEDPEKDDIDAERWKGQSSEPTHSTTSGIDDLNFLNDDDIIRVVTKYVKEKHKINSDKVIAIYDIAKERRSNKLINFVKSLTRLVRESKKPHMNIKTKLLEYLVRSCVKEVLTQMDEEEKKLKVKPFVKGRGFKPKIKSSEIGKDGAKGNVKKLDEAGGTISNSNEFHTDEKGAMCKYCGSPAKIEKSMDGSSKYVCINKRCIKGGGTKSYHPFKEVAGDEQNPEMAPPAAGQGTADQPPIPKDKPKEPLKPEEPAEPPPPSLKGAVLVNPRDKSKLQPLKIQARDDASLERTLHRTAASIAGPHVKVALATMRMAKEIVKNPNATVYLYFGKYDPESEEVFLMADKSLQIAKDATVQPSELTGTPVGDIAPSDYNPMTASPTDIVTRMNQGGHTPVRGSGIDEEFHKIVKKLVNEILDRK